MADRRREDSVDDSENGLASRLSDILVADGDGDLLLQRSERDDNLLQWLQALDLQVMGACRADERLKPLLKANTFSGVAEERLVAHLSQHFEAAEVGLLARCLCVPLVSMRVGKVVKQGTLLCPTSIRGILNLTLLPSSDLRISFVGDDGHTQRLATLHHVSESSDVAVEEISADQSGRSFQIKLAGGEPFYYWCSEKSKLLGIELLHKMKDLLEKKPTLPELTRISESRLECFATHLRGYLAGSNVSTQANAVASSVPWVDMRPNTEEEPNLSMNTQSLPTSVRHLRPRNNGCQTLKGHTLYQASLSARSSTFKECLPRTFSSLKTASREKLKRRGDLHRSTDDLKDSVISHSDIWQHSEASGSSSTSSLSNLDSLGNCNFPLPCATSQFPPFSSLLSPYYCWCPPCTSAIKAPVPQLPTSTSSEPFSLPPLSSLLPVTGPLVDLAGGGSPLELPAFVSDPLARLPFTTQSSQQIPTFIPLMCDPIVHIPILDVCSSGPGYLVSAGPGIATSIPPLHPKLVGPMMPETESMVDKGARETLRLLIGASGSQASASLMNVLPVVLNEDKQGVMVAGSRGLYTGTSDVDAIVNNFATVGLASLSEKSLKICSLRVAGSDPLPDDVGQPCAGLDLQDSTSTFMSTEKEDY